MSWERNELGRLVRRFEFEPPLSPGTISEASSDSWSSIALSVILPTHHKTNNLKRQISTFSQKDSETLYQSWERFKELLNMCPHHWYESWHLVSYFYEGLTYRER